MWSSPAGRDYTKGMSDTGAAELLALVASLDSYMDGPAFLPKAVGYDALAVAKRDQDLIALRLYNRLFPTGANVRHIKDAVTTAKLFPNGGLADLTVEQVETHAIVAKAIEGATGAAATRIKKIALMYPGQGDLIVELIAEREISDPDQIRDILAQAKSVSTPLHDGVL
jgi:hypothetical protein